MGNREYPLKNPLTEYVESRRIKLGTHLGKASAEPLATAVTLFRSVSLQQRKL